MGNLCAGRQADDDKYRQILAKYEMSGQGHVLKYYEQLNPTQKKELLKDLQSFDPQIITRLFNDLVKQGGAKNEDAEESAEMERIEQDLVFSAEGHYETVADLLTSKDFEPNDDVGDLPQYLQSGLDMIKKGKVSVVILAGGQGSRLGFDHPKGMYDIGLPSKKSIFQILAERFLRVQMLAHGADKLTPQVQKCKMLIMTSAINHAETEKFFKDNKYFGGEASSFIFFSQAVIPAVDLEGKIILKSKHELQLSPNGNGGFFEAVNTNKEVKSHIEKTEYVQVIGVDNVLNKILDPLQIGFMAGRGLEASLKCCTKRDPSEKVGVVLMKNGKYDIVEYSELSDEQAAQENDDGSLYFDLGSILIFMLSTKKLLALCQDSKTLNQLYHKAFKKIEAWNEGDGKAIKPSKENGYKFELFLHNFLPFCDSGKFGAIKVDRIEEFGPVKNANGPSDEDPVNDSPAQAKMLLLEQHTRFLEFQVGRSDLGADKLNEALDNQLAELELLSTYAGEGVATEQSLTKIKLQ